MSQNIIDLLQERGFIEALTNEEELRQHVKQPLSVYCGFDPSSDSLHLGNMVAIMGLAWFQRLGHLPIVLLGGATGMIGDPSGKSVERQLLDSTRLQENIKGIEKNLRSILKSTRGSTPLFLNNYDWFKNFSFIDFLRDVGKYFRLGPMLAKESVRARLNSEEGMSFTEFSYQLLQGYDFLHLFNSNQVMVQLGGSDQWGNITAGTELIRKVTGESAYGITFPLLMRADGQKFGKSEKGAIWLSPEKLSPYEFYQYLFRVSDEEVIPLMRLLTFMEMEEIRAYKEKMGQPDYIPNSAQKRLAREVTEIVHGEEGVKLALKVTEGAAPGAQTSLDVAVLESLAGDMPSYFLKREEAEKISLLDLLVSAQLVASKGEGRRLIANGGIYLNNQKVEKEISITRKDFIEEKILLLSVGKKNKLLVRLRD